MVSAITLAISSRFLASRAMAAAVSVAILVVLARAVLGATYPLAGLYSVLLGFTVAAFAGTFTREAARSSERKRAAWEAAEECRRSFAAAMDDGLLF